MKVEKSKLQVSILLEVNCVGCGAVGLGNLEQGGG